MLIFGTTIFAVALGKWILFTLTILASNFLDFEVPVELICRFDSVFIWQVYEQTLYLTFKCLFFKETIFIKL